MDSAESRDRDQACNECRRRKARCDKTLPECGPCKKNRRHCLYERHSKTPLTRKYLTEVEEELRRAQINAARAEERARIAETRLRAQLQQRPRSAPEETADDIEHGPSTTLLEITEDADSIAETIAPAVDEPPISFEGPPSGPADFSWDEQSPDTGLSEVVGAAPTNGSQGEDERTVDGMASLTVDDSEAGYLGVASGAAMLRLLLPDAHHNRPLRPASRSKKSNVAATHFSNHLLDTPLWDALDLGSVDFDGSINAYFALYHNSYPLVEEHTFRAQYAHVIPRPNGRSWHALAFMIAAVGHFTSATHPTETDRRLFLAAQSNLSIDSLETGNITLVQTLTLISNYLQKRNKPNSGYNYLGLALHMAMGLGLHKEFRGWDISPLNMESRRRVWWCIFVFSVGAAITFGRPLAWPNKNVELSLPLNISSRALTNLSRTIPGEVDHATPYSSVIIQSKFHMLTNEIYTRVISMPYPPTTELIHLDDTLIKAWETSVPAWYRVDAIIPLQFATSHAIMWWRKMNFRIIMYRPYVMRRVLQARSRDNSNAVPPAAQEAYNRCLHEAEASITAISNFWSTSSPTRLAAWYALYFLFQASLIPCVCLRNEPTSTLSPSWRSQIRQTMLTPPSAMEEAAVNAKINDDGTITVVDFFMPMEKNDLDGADKDLGTSPLQLLPADVFSCPNHRRIGVVTGKSGKTYWLNLDNLGGYQMGPNAGDSVIQVFQNENSVYAGAGVMPLGGGYVYIAVTQYPTHAFKFSCDGSGNAKFTKVADTPDKNAYTVGTSHGTATSMDGNEGTGMLWFTDVQGQGLRVYDPIPPASGGNLKLVRNFTVAGVTKFSKPVFGDGRVYISTIQGYIHGFGAPVNQALNCTSADFGAVPIGLATASKTIVCAAVADTTVSTIDPESTSDFTLSSIPSLPLKLKSGQFFSFNATASPSNVGAVARDITIQLINSVAGLSSVTTVTMRANGHSATPVLAISPSSIMFSVLEGSSRSQSILFRNVGDSALTFTNVSFSLVSQEGPWAQPDTTSDGSLQISDFIVQRIPDSILATRSATITVVYAPSTAGPDTVYVRAFSDGGSKTLDLVGLAGTQPKAVIEFQKPDGTGWVPYSSITPFDFGTVYEAQTKNLLMRITNGGGPKAVPLSITVSKPPYGVPGIIGKDNVIDLAEGSSIAANKSATANLYCAVPKSQVNLPNYSNSTTWTLNTGDPKLGKQIINFTCTAAAEQVGPLYTNGSAQYGYIGCFKENNPGRQLAQLAYSDTGNNTNGRCITACQNLGYVFAGTQYAQECWCGNAIPIQKNADTNCNYGCTGNSSQTCGGNGIFHDTTHISLFADSSRFSGNTTSPPLRITPIVGSYKFIGCYAESAGKTVSQKSTSSNFMTVDVCASFCSGSTYFGLEFSAECYCGTSLNPSSTLSDQSQCDLPCKGSNSEYCGGSSRMQIYHLNGTLQSTSSSAGASSTANSTGRPSTNITGSTTSSSASATASSSTFLSTSTTLRSSFASSSISLSNSESTAFSSATISSTIWSSTSLTSAPSSSSDASDASSRSTWLSSTPSAIIPSSTTPGTSTTTSKRSSTSTASSSGTAIPISTSASTTTLSSPSAPPIPTPRKLSDYTSIGCLIDKSDRQFNDLSIANSSMTNDLCAIFCTGYTWFGTEYGTECYCENTFPTSILSATDGRCNTPCAANPTQICGGGFGLSAYQFTNFSLPPQINGFAALGCYAEKPAARALRYVYYSDSMTVSLCAQRAAASGYAWFGLQYGGECWMDSVLDGAVLGNQTSCGIACKGNSYQSCGGLDYMQLYGNGNGTSRP